MCVADLVREAVNKHKTIAVQLSDGLAAHPELGNAEFESSRKMVELLKSAGYQVKYPFSGLPTSFCGTLDNGEGPSVALLVEYDALPDIGHGCGHNLHGSMAILAGLALTELKQHFKGKVFVIGTPSEEIDGAKTRMSAGGVFDDMDMAMMIHSFSGGVNEPAMRCLALKCYNFTFKGQTAHASACPWEGRNALTAARKFLDLLDARRESYTPDVRVSSVVLEGGKRPNVIPDISRVQVEFRAETFSRLEGVTDIMLKCAKAAAMAFDCEVEWSPDIPDFADLVKNEVAENAISDILRSLGVEVRPCSPAVGSSDIGNVSYRCPALHPILSINDEPINLHTTEFARATTLPQAHDTMAIGARALAEMSLKVFNDPDLRSAIREEFNRRVKK